MLALLSSSSDKAIGCWRLEKNVTFCLMPSSKTRKSGSVEVGDVVVGAVRDRDVEGDDVDSRTERGLLTGQTGNEADGHEHDNERQPFHVRLQTLPGPVHHASSRQRAPKTPRRARELMSDCGRPYTTLYCEDNSRASRCSASSSPCGLSSEMR